MSGKNLLFVCVLRLFDERKKFIVRVCFEAQSIFSVSMGFYASFVGFFSVPLLI